MICLIVYKIGSWHVKYTSEIDSSSRNRVLSGSDLEVYYSMLYYLVAKAVQVIGIGSFIAVFGNPVSCGLSWACKRGRQPQCAQGSNAEFFFSAIEYSLLNGLRVSLPPWLCPVAIGTP